MPASSGAAIGFVMPDDAGSPVSDALLAGHWRQADVRRAIAAAEKAGLASYRIEIAADGTISIVVGEPPEMAREA